MLRALTIWQPWAWCICPGPRSAPKRVENRSWTPSPEQLAPGDYLAVHAAARVEPAEEEYVARRLRETMGVFVPEQPVRGAILGVAVFDGVALIPRWLEGPGGPRPDPWYAVGDGSTVGWYLRDVVTLPEPVPCRGQQGLWTVDGELLERVRRAWSAATRGVDLAVITNGGKHAS